MITWISSHFSKAPEILYLLNLSPVARKTEHCGWKAKKKPTSQNAVRWPCSENAGVLDCGSPGLWDLAAEVPTMAGMSCRAGTGEFQMI